MAQHAFRGKEARFLVQNPAHVLVGRHQAFHQHVGVARHDGRHGLLHALHVVLFVDDVERVDVDAVFAAHFFDDGLFAVEGRFDQPFLIGFVDCLQRVGVLPVGYGQPFAAFLSRLFDDFGKMLNHGYLFSVFAVFPNGNNASVALFTIHY